ncbi:MAG: hypothetical protein A3H93_09830 [Rhodocyclales bacterium RIFCSPLOWO2_02_FULL_63_24]|nr:MAG: hypothetical protein A3H93_09830 [Rhodocyclales bacterium RIFCSPLOWO2_02_FULL_63_24]
MLDLRTLALINFLSYGVFFLAALTVWRLVPQERSLREWTTASGLAALSALLLGLRGIIPDFLSIVVANSVLVLSLGVLHVGTRKLLGVDRGYPWHWYATGTMFLAAIVFTYFAPSLSARIMVVSLLLVPFFIACGWLFWRRGDAQIGVVDRFTALMFMGGAALFLVRMATASSTVVSADYRSTPSWIVASPYVYSILFNVWMSVMLALKVSARLQQRLGEALGRAEAANRELNETLGFNKAILVNSPLPIGVYSASGQCVLANDAYAQFVGVTRESLVAQNFHDIDSWRESGLPADCQKTLAQNSPQRREVHVINSLGKELWSECRMVPTQINGEQHLLVQFFDLTENKLAEQSLLRGKEQLSAILNSTTESIFQVDSQGIILAINEMACRRVHKTPQDMIGRCAFDFFPPEVEPGRRSTLAEVFASGKGTCMEDMRGDHFFSLNYYPIFGSDGEVASVVVYATDITERRRLEQGIAQSEQRMELALAAANLGLWDLDIGSGRVTHNARLVTMLGYEPDATEMDGKTLLSLIHPSDAPGFGYALQAHVKGATASFEVEYRARHKDDHWVWIQSRGKVVARDADGRALRMTGTNLDISERKASEAVLKAREERLSKLIASMQDLVFVFDTGGAVMEYFRPPQARCPSWKLREDVIGKTYTELFPADVAGRYGQAIAEIMMEGQSQTFEYSVSVNGVDCIFHATLSQLAGEDRYPTGFLAVVHDITERKRVEQELRIAATAFETREGLMVTDSESTILRVNRAFTELTGYSAAEVVGKTPALLKSGHHDEAFYRQLWATLTTRKFWDGEIWDRRKNGEVFPEWLTISAVSGPDGEVSHYVGIFSDITDRKLAEERIHNLAFYDPLTQLPNRRLLLDRLGQAQSASARRQNHGAILFLDLDNFKLLNDTRGHESGDQLLVEVAQRMMSCVRAEDTVARLGGDEFVVLLEDLDRDAQVAAVQAMEVAEKIRKALNRSYEIQGHSHHSAASIGVSLFKGTEIPISELLMRADNAMYQSKAAGRNKVRLYDAGLPIAENS